MKQNPAELWSKCLLVIKNNVSEQQYKTWFEPIVFESYTPASMTIVVKVPSPFVYEYLEENFIDLISKVLKREFGNGVKLAYKIVTDKTNNIGMVVDSDNKEDDIEKPLPRTRANQSYSVLDAAQPQPIDSQLNPQHTFENFIEGASNKLPRAVGLSIAQNPFTTQFNPMFIYGPSGCGKSMTLKSIAGIVNPDSGVISVTADNEDVYFDSNKKINLKPQNRNVGYLFQNYALFPNMTVEENIGIGVEKENRERTVPEMIKRFHLHGLEKRYPRQLSGGQQQRVALARILAYGPDVILLDEPFSAMDTFLKEQLRLELVNSLKDFDGFSVMVTHDRDEAFQFCDELIVLDKGKIIAKGETYQIFENPGKVQVARLTGCKNISRIEIIDDYHVKSLDWGLELEVSKKVSPNITHIGIRAHDFSSANEDDLNAFDTLGSTKIEMPFEWEITLANGLWWKYRFMSMNLLFLIT